MNSIDSTNPELSIACRGGPGEAIPEYPGEVDVAAAWYAAGGMLVLTSDERVAASEQAAQPVLDWLEVDPFNAELIAEIRELKANPEPSTGGEACAL